MPTRRRARPHRIFGPVAASGICSTSCGSPLPDGWAMAGHRSRPRDRLQDRHLVRLSRRLDGRRVAPLHGRRLDRAGRRLDAAGRTGAQRRRSGDAAGVRAAARRAGPFQAAAEGRAHRRQCRTIAARAPAFLADPDGGGPRHAVPPFRSSPSARRRGGGVERSGPGADPAADGGSNRCAGWSTALPLVRRRLRADRSGSRARGRLRARHGDRRRRPAPASSRIRLKRQM